MKQSSTSVVVMSDAERRERLRNRIYAVFPVVSVLLLILLWFLAAGAENSTFPSPVDIWNRFLLLMEKPIKQLNLFGHIWASLLRVFIALAFAWLLGISFGILIGWNKKANALLGPLFTAFRSVPPLAWVPLMTMWFGTGEFPMCRTCTSMWVPFSTPTSGRCSLKSLFHRLWTPFLPV